MSIWVESVDIHDSQLNTWAWNLVMLSLGALLPRKRMQPEQAGLRKSLVLCRNEWGRGGEEDECLGGD